MPGSSTICNYPEQRSKVIVIECEPLMKMKKQKIDNFFIRGNPGSHETAKQSGLRILQHGCFNHHLFVILK